MRHIKISLPSEQRWRLNCGYVLECPVRVDWPELQLTPEQQKSNTLALVSGKNPPYEDHSRFAVVLMRYTNVR
jgi:hypothetical protein